ncbi:MAG: GyrI-like domain-containing protein [Alphaproteobacteria bacterium]|nr:GyrI-like domain-containing protein [Alphaproteobacteria bacterium]
MAVRVSLETVRARRLAAVTRQVAFGGVGAAWRPALDLVWQFVRRQPGLHQGGHNIFVYQQPMQPGGPMTVAFGVEVTRPFTGQDEVKEVFTPEGEAAMAVHVGPYDRMRETHRAVQTWAAAQGRALSGRSLEIYGDWSDDPTKLETTILYLLR